MTVRLVRWLVLILGWVIASASFALDSKPVLSLEVAKAIAAGCEAKAKAEGWLINVAVVDAGANLVAFSRMDGAFLGSIDVAIKKAKTSARFPFPTRVFANLAYGEDAKGGPLPGLAHIKDVMAFAGGLPVKAGEVHIGGVGVSGVTADQDEACAQAGLEAAASMLK